MRILRNSLILLLISCVIIALFFAIDIKSGVLHIRYEFDTIDKAGPRSIIYTAIFFLSIISLSPIAVAVWRKKKK